jgi:predicted  nucleic acid-binding Zn-ribbon protein
MNNLDTSLENYSQSKAVLDKDNQDLKNNNAELQKLKQQSSEVEQVLEAISKKLQFADRALAAGELTTDEFLSSKEEHHSEESRLNILNDAIKAQENARKIILDSRSNSAGILKESRRRVAIQMSQKLFSEISEQQQLKDLVDSFLGSQQPERLFNREGKEQIFRDLGMKLMEATFLVQKRRPVGTIGTFEVYERVDEMIADSQ